MHKGNNFHYSLIHDNEGLHGSFFFDRKHGSIYITHTYSHWPHTWLIPIGPLIELKNIHVINVLSVN